MRLRMKVPVLRATWRSWLSWTTASTMNSVLDQRIRRKKGGIIQGLEVGSTMDGARRVVKMGGEGQCQGCPGFRDLNYGLVVGIAGGLVIHAFKKAEVGFIHGVRISSVRFR